MDKELLHKYFNGKATEKEERQIMEWIDSAEENRESYLRERLLFDACLFTDLSHLRRKPRASLYLYPAFAIVAMLSIVFVMDLPHMHKPKPAPAPIACDTTALSADSLNTGEKDLDIPFH